MNFDLSSILLGLPLAFGLGWLASRMDLRQLRLENRQAPKAYFKGLNYLLNEQQDKAIDAFIEAMQSDPDTAELHFALGNLFRRRGEYGRAVRVHEHLLSRADLSSTDHQRAQWGLAQDYLKAGLLDRAEEALRRLENSPHAAQARLALLGIYERSRDWVQAAHIVRTMQQAGQGDFSSRLAHYLCEQAAQSSPAPAELPQALKLLEQAQTIAPQAPRPRLEAARVLQRLGQPQAAWQGLLDLAQAAPAALPLALPLLLELAEQLGQQERAVALLRQRQQQAPSLDVLLALVQLNADPDGEGGQRLPPSKEGDSGHHGNENGNGGEPEHERQTSHTWLLRYLTTEPSLVAANQWLQGQAGGSASQAALALHPPVPCPPAEIAKALEHAARPLMRYRCAACGFEARQHFWHCPGCQSWDSYPARRVEEL
ncbi:MAG: lipopolysaccharide assembly protein LapB [Comamonas sp.]|nr:lipopolysaccharide assembly protein LapB [Comamonas sp.]